MTSIAAVVVVGAGPYGLSIAAHLAARGLAPLVFGRPMDSWREGMPQGMRLKSEGFASCLSDPAGVFTLGRFCEDEGLPYADLDLPVPVETFAAYGVAFQDRFVPQLDRRLVRQVRAAPHGFDVELEDGVEIAARWVIVAAGIRPYSHVPAALEKLSPERLSHTADRADYTGFAGRRVAVIGAGASAIDAAAALQRAGAIVDLISRRAAITFYAAGTRRWWHRLKAPMTPLGPGWKKLLCVKAPLLFRALPETMRVTIVRRYLGPAPGWSARDHVEGKVALTLSADVVEARESAAGVELVVSGPDGRRVLEPFDHVVAGTGYRVDVRALPFLDRTLAGDLALTADAPRLSASFETNIAGLYFAGTAAAFAFGPMLRFVCGADFAARRISRHVAAAAARDARHAAGAKRLRSVRALQTKTVSVGDASRA